MALSTSDYLHASVMRCATGFLIAHLARTMTKHHHDQNMPDKEKYAREHSRLVRPPRLQPKVKEGMMQPVRKPKGGKKGSIPRM